MHGVVPAPIGTHDSGAGIAMYDKLTPNQRRCIERLRTFDAFAFDESAATGQRGRWRALIGDRIGPTFDGRLILEIGCADGAFLARIATKDRRAAFVGLDWKYGDLLRAAERIEAASLANVSLIRGPAQLPSRYFADGELDEIWIFHPDPCARANERPNRLISESFLLDAARAISGGGPLTLKTDHAGYYQSTLALLGLPEPDWASTSPRVRQCDLMSNDELPAASDAVRRAWTASHRSIDFWNDLAVQTHVAARPFAGERTNYEQRFFAKRRPIFHLELKNR